ncbi:MAG: tRNA (guanosine(46)-N7)-methyltransferase TrmB [Cyclobacteriaceae bacterium]
MSKNSQVNIISPLGKKNKLQKFSENKLSHNVIEPGKSMYETISGHWSSYFGNENEIVVELACGKGEYTLALAEMFPKRNYIGVDLKGERVWRGSQEASQRGLNNVAFLRTHISNIPELFAENEVSEIWLTFPDPRPKDRDEKHRLSNAFYLNIYERILAKNGWFKFKTDSTSLFDYTMEILEKLQVKDQLHTYDLYNSELLEDHYGIKTKYEKIWTEKGENVKYMKFKFA